MAKHLCLTALLIACAATTSTARPTPTPTPTPGTTTPEIGYVRLTYSGRSRIYDLRLANEDGSGASSIYSVKDGGQMVPKMGPRDQRTILLIQGGQLNFAKYTITSTGPQLLSIDPLVRAHDGSGAAQADLSRNGRDVVYVTNIGRTIRRYHIPTGSITDVTTVANNINTLAFNHDGTSVYFVEGLNESVVRSVPLVGGEPTEVTRGNFGSVRSARANPSYALVTSGTASSQQIHYYPFGGTPRVIGNGYVPSFRCDDASVIYQKVNPDSSVSQLRHDLVGGATVTFSTKENYWVDYIPTC